MSNPYANYAQPTYPNAEKAPKKKPRKRWVKWLIAIVSIFAVIIVGLYGMLLYGAHLDAEGAKEACTEGVTYRAKYPGGVSFPKEVELTTSAGLLDNHRVYKTAGTVDFPNGWGTPVRELYTCSITMSAGEVIDVDVDVVELNK